jgi:hypothetical protein
MKNSYSVIESNNDVTNKLLDNCTVEEIEDLYKFLDSQTLRTIAWYCRISRNRKMVKLLLDDKYDLSIRYEFSPVHDEEL